MVTGFADIRIVTWPQDRFDDLLCHLQRALSIPSCLSSTKTRQPTTSRKPAFFNISAFISQYLVSASFSPPRSTDWHSDTTTQRSMAAAEYFNPGGGQGQSYPSGPQPGPSSYNGGNLTPQNPPYPMSGKQSSHYRLPSITRLTE